MSDVNRISIPSIFVEDVSGKNDGCRPDESPSNSDENYLLNLPKSDGLQCSGGMNIRPRSAPLRMPNLYKGERRASVPFIPIEDVKPVEGRDKLVGSDLIPFFRMWKSSPDISRSRAVTPPAAVSRQTMYRDCGCYTREFMKSRGRTGRSTIYPDC